MIMLSGDIYLIKEKNTYNVYFIVEKTGYFYT